MKYGVNKESLKRIIELAERSEEFNSTDKTTLETVKKICECEDELLFLAVENDYKATILWNDKEAIECALDGIWLSDKQQAFVDNLTEEERKSFIEDVNSGIHWGGISDVCRAKGFDFIEEVLLDKMSEKISIKEAESLGWTVTQCDEFYELKNLSPAGEELCFMVDVGHFAYDVKLYAHNFNEESHVKMWLSAASDTVVVPDKSVLLEDAKEIKKMLDALYDACYE